MIRKLPGSVIKCRRWQICLNDSDPVNPEEIESKEQMPQKSTRETIDIPDSNDLLWISLNRNSGKIMIPMNF